MICSNTKTEVKLKKKIIVYLFFDKISLEKYIYI